MMHIVCVAAFPHGQHDWAGTSVCLAENHRGRSDPECCRLIVRGQPFRGRAFTDPKLVEVSSLACPIRRLRLRALTVDEVRVRAVVAYVRIVNRPVPFGEV